MTYQPKKGFLLQKKVKRIAPKSSFLKKLERDQAALAHPAVTKADRVVTLLEGYKERRK